MQAKDLDNKEFLNAIHRIEIDTKMWVHRLDLGEYFPTVPAKVILAKAKTLIKQGLMDGCDCGCRGDFELTKKGIEYISNNPDLPTTPGTYLPDERSRMGNVAVASPDTTST